MTRLKSLFDTVAPMRDGIGGAVLAHAGCVALPVLAGAAGVGLSATFTGAAMFIGAPVIAVALTYGMSRYQKCDRPSWQKLAGTAAAAFAVSAAIHFGLGHDHSGHHDHHQHQGMHAEQQDGIYHMDVFIPASELCISPN